MEVEATSIPGVILLRPRVFTDARGWFFESWNRERYEGAGVAATFVQDNVSRSSRGTVRGLHFQHPCPQGKLISVLEGEVFDVAVDIRRGSPTFGRHVAAVISESNRLQLYIPPGFAHGFMVTSEHAVFHYKCTETYRPEHDRSIRWNDPTLGIDWPPIQPLLSEKDASAPALGELSPELLPR